MSRKEDARQVIFELIRPKPTLRVAELIFLLQMITGLSKAQVIHNIYLLGEYE